VKKKGKERQDEEEEEEEVQPAERVFFSLCRIVLKLYIFCSTFLNEKCVCVCVCLCVCVSAGYLFRECDLHAVKIISPKLWGEGHCCKNKKKKKPTTACAYSKCPA